MAAADKASEITTLSIHPVTQRVYRIPKSSLICDHNHPVVMEFDIFEQMAASGILSAERFLHHSKNDGASFSASQIVSVKLNQQGGPASGSPLYAWGSRMITMIPDDDELPVVPDYIGDSFLWLWPLGKAYNAFLTRKEKRRIDPSLDMAGIDEHPPTCRYTPTTPGLMLGPDDIEGAVPVKMEDLTWRERLFVMLIRPQQSLFPRRPQAVQWSDRVMEITDVNQATGGGVRLSVIREKVARMNYDADADASRAAQIAPSPFPPHPLPDRHELPSSDAECEARLKRVGAATGERDSKRQRTNDPSASTTTTPTSTPPSSPPHSSDDVPVTVPWTLVPTHYVPPAWTPWMAQKKNPNASASDAFDMAHAFNQRSEHLFGSRPPPLDAINCDSSFEHAFASSYVPMRARVADPALEFEHWADCPHDVLMRILCMSASDALVGTVEEARSGIGALRLVSKGACALVDSFVGTQTGGLHKDIVNACLGSRFGTIKLNDIVPVDAATAAARARALGLGVLDAMRLGNRQVKLSHVENWTLPRTPSQVPQWRWYLELRRQSEAEMRCHRVVRPSTKPSAQYELVRRNRSEHHHVWSHLACHDHKFDAEYDELVVSAGERDVRNVMCDSAGV